jgi:hypothetical protein
LVHSNESKITHHTYACLTTRFAADNSQQDLSPTTRQKSVHGKEKSSSLLTLVVTYYCHHEEDHPLCSTCFLLLDLFDDHCAQLPGLRDSNFWCCYYWWCVRLPTGTSIFASFHHDRSRKRQGVQATKRFISQTSWQGFLVQQYQERDLKRRASTPTIELTQEQKEKKCRQKVEPKPFDHRV